MKVTLKAKVKGNFKEVISRFDKDLFEYLKPKNAQMEIVEFTGSKKGDKVHLRFHKPLKMEWISHITEDFENQTESYFVDQGVVLPSVLGYWKHIHRVNKIDEHNSVIIDEMTFKAKWSLFTVFLYPGILIAFMPRKKLYQAYFGHPTV